MKFLNITLLLFFSQLLFAQVDTGIASYYGDEFNGKKTSSGEIYNPKSYTAAHRTLRFGIKLLVTNLDNGKTVVVTVNDRGPFVKDRLIDVSKIAAKKLGMLPTGTAKVSIRPIPFDVDPDKFAAQYAEKIEKTEKTDSEEQAAAASASPESTATPDAPAATQEPVLKAAEFLQVGSFKSLKNAKTLADLLVEQGFKPHIHTHEGLSRVYLISTGKDQSEELQAKLIKEGHTKPLLLNQEPLGEDGSLTSN